MTRRVRFLVWVATLAAIAAAATAAVTMVPAPDPAYGATTTAGPPPVHWLVKSFDLPRMATRAQFQWVACLGPQGLRCQPGDVPTFTRMQDFRAYVAAGHRGTVLYDPEGWPVTPHYQYVHMWRYLRIFEQLATAHGIRVIA